MKNIWHLIEKILGIYHWHPKIALRYLPIVDDFKNDLRLEQGTMNVLEIGSGGLGIAPYLKRRVVGIDIKFPSLIDNNMVPIKANSCDLPFADNSFSYVVCMDMLEHVNIKDRISTIHELIRVGDKKIYLGIPIGKDSSNQDQQIADIFKKKYYQDFPYLLEHNKYGLPVKNWAISTIQKEASKLNIQVNIKVINNINLKLRMWLMKGWISNNLLVNIFYRKYLFFFIPIMRKMNHLPVYRQIFIVTIKK